MGLSNRNKKRILIFTLVPVLAGVQLLTDDMLFRAIAAVLLVVYVGFIVFLRDSLRSEEIFPEIDETESLPGTETEEISSNNHKMEVDIGEGVEIISKPKEIEFLTETNLDSVRKSSPTMFKTPDVKKQFDEIANEEFPHGVDSNEQFLFILEKILSVIKEAYLANTVVFFWYNPKTERLILEKYVSSSTDIIPQKFKLENDILSKIVKTEEPEFLTDITPSAEKDALRYYTRPQNIKSFVGVPLFYNKKLRGVLGLDSKGNDTFGIETIYSLGKFIRVISIIIGLYDKKFSESQSKKRLDALLGILRNDNIFVSSKELYKSIEDAVQELIEWDAFAFVMYDPKEKKFKISNVTKKRPLKYVGENMEIDLESSLVGKSILSGKPVSIGKTPSDSFIRYNKSEDVSLSGSFLAVPLIYNGKNYGVLCFEHLKDDFYNSSSINFLKSTTRIFSFILYSYSTNSYLRSLLTVDVDTKTLNYNSFLRRMEEDLIKAASLKVPAVLTVIRIDDFMEEDTLFESNPFEKVLKSIHGFIAEDLTPLNLFGRLDKRVFGVFFFNQNPKNVFLWAEKLRIKIARSPIAVHTKQTTFTVSIGVAPAGEKIDAERLLHNAELALKKAMDKGGNEVINAT